ncbi:MAG: hypothetical protein R2939_09215 [Kofleriaceae bacterium]
MPPRLLDPASYALRLLSAPYAAAALALAVVFVTVALMRGASTLRAWLLLATLALMPYVAALAVIASTTDPAVAGAWYRLAGASVPLAGGAWACFLMALRGALRERAWLAVLVTLVGVAWAPIIAATDVVVAGVGWGGLGMWEPTAGPGAPWPTAQARCRRARPRRADPCLGRRPSPDAVGRRRHRGRHVAARDRRPVLAGAGRRPAGGRRDRHRRRAVVRRPAPGARP